MGKSSRDKGSRGEREVAALFRDAGFPCERVPNSGGLYIPGDITGVDGLHIEVKRTERLQLWAALEQAQEDAEPFAVPLVVFRRNHAEWHAALPLADLLAVLK